MTAGKLIIDGLWHCLCPSIETSTLLQTRKTLRISPNVPSIARKSPPLRQCSVRSFVSAGTLAQGNSQQEPSWATGAENPHGTVRSASLRSEPSFAWKIRSNEELYETLPSIARKGYQHTVEGIVSYLVKEKEEKPSARMYAALILSNVNAKRGSAWNVQVLLDEMDAQRVQIDSGVVHATLKVNCLTFSRAKCI
jgi:hypothetical protein